MRRIVFCIPSVAFIFAFPFVTDADEFVIYNRVLTEDEIRQDMEQVLSVSPLDKAATTWGMLKRVKR